VPVETEWQFDAIHLAPVQRWLLEVADGPVRVVPGRSRTQIDRYFDTADLRIHQAGRTLRIRQTGRTAEATLKERAPADDGLRRRIELTEALSTPDPASIVRGDGPIDRRVRAVVGRRQLEQLFEVRTRRQIYTLEVAGTDAGEVALDRTVISLAGEAEPARLRRVEVELWSEAEEEVAGFVDRMRRECALQPATVSKYGAGFLAGGLVEPGTPDFGPTTIDRTSSVGGLAFAALRRHFAEVLAHEPGTRLDEDPEELHDMRVATRRIRAVMGIFGHALPMRAARFRTEFGWLADLLGAVRDLDVQIERTEGWSLEREASDPEVFAVLLRILQERRTEAREALLDGLESSRYVRLIEGFSGFLRRGPLRHLPASVAPALTVLPDTVGLQYRKVWKAGRRLEPDSPLPEFHRLRIRCKRLRYTLEAVTDLYGRPARVAIRRLTDLQDLLGEHQDAQVAIERLRSMALAPDSELSPATVFAMGQIAERYALRAATLRRALPKPLRRLDRRWRGLRRAMEAAAEDVPPPAAVEPAEPGALPTRARAVPAPLASPGRPGSR